MENWFKTLTTRDLLTWLGNMERYRSLHLISPTAPSSEDLKAAKAELKNRRKAAKAKLKNRRAS